MVPFVPEVSPDISKIYIFAGTRDLIVSRQQTEELANLLRDLGSNINIHWQDGAGHELKSNKIQLAKNWLSI